MTTSRIDDLSVARPGTEEDEVGVIHPALEPLIYEMRKVLVAQEELIEALVIALLCEGHVLIEGMPGLAKTHAAMSLARASGLQFARIQMTPDMMPSDLLGTQVFNPSMRMFEVFLGPIFNQVVVIDEINRAPAKVQSALLEVMQERQVTIGQRSYSAPRPFMVVATQNPIESTGVYPLPEAQIDRFLLNPRVRYPNYDDEVLIAQRVLQGMPPVNAVLDASTMMALIDETKRVHVDMRVIGYATAICQATREPKVYQVPHPERIQYGAGPRGTLALLMAARARAFLHRRNYVKPSDIAAVAPMALRHRIVLSLAAAAQGEDVDTVIDDILRVIPRPNP